MAKGKKWALGGGLILIAAIIGGILVGWWLFRHVDAHLLLSDQPVTVALPGAIPIRAKVLNNLDITLDTKLKTQVPIDQTITVPIKDTLHVHVAFDHDVPIKMQVPVHATIPVDQIIPIDSKVKVDVLGVPITLPIKGNVPIKAEIPVNLTIPVDQQVHLKFTAPAAVTLDEPLKLPLKARIDAVVPISGHLSVPLKSDLVATAHIPGLLHAVIKHADLNLPLHTLRLSWAGSDKGGDKSRGESAAAPAASGAAPPGASSVAPPAASASASSHVATGNGAQ